MAEGVRKRGKSWSYYFDTAKINGERKKIEKGGFRTQKEALEARAAAIAEYNNTGRSFTPKEISVADYLDYWLENAIRKNIDHGYTYKEWYMKPPKYDSYRTLKIGSTLEQELKYVIQRQKINRMKYGGNYMKTYLLPDGSITQIKADVTVSYQEITPLCVKDNGSLVTPDSFKYCARVIHMELGNVLFHAHCLRHTHGTILAENGVNPKTVMERLGHKDIQTTLRTYTFNTEVMQQTAVDIFEQAVQ